MGGEDGITGVDISVVSTMVTLLAIWEGGVVVPVASTGMELCTVEDGNREGSSVGVGRVSAIESETDADNMRC